MYEMNGFFLSMFLGTKISRRVLDGKVRTIHTHAHTHTHEIVPYGTVLRRIGIVGFHVPFIHAAHISFTSSITGIMKRAEITSPKNRNDYAVLKLSV